jgi:O-antigen/teichoic acid export membrane protein
LIKPIWIFGLDRSVQNAIGTEEYGIYFALLNFSFLFNMMLDMGISYYNNRNVAQNNQLLTKFFSKIIAVKMLLGIFYFVFSMIIAWVLGYESFQLKLLFILLFNQFLISFIFFMRSNISGLHFFALDSVISVLDRLLMIVFCGLLLWGNMDGLTINIKWFVLAQTLAYLITVVFAFMVVLIKSPSMSWKFNTAYAFFILKKSFPYAVLVFVMMIYSRIDIVMLERVLINGKMAAGIYAQGYRILEAFNMFSFLFAGLLLPIFSKMLKDHSPLAPLTGLASKLLLIPAFIFVVSCFVYSEDIISLLYHEHIQRSSLAFSVLILSALPISATYIFGTLLTANENLKQMIFISVFGVVISVCLNLILIPRFEVLGAAISTLTTQLFIAIAQIVLCRLYFRFNISKWMVFKAFLLVCSVVLFSMSFKIYFSSWVLALCFSACLGLLVGVWLKLIDLRDINHLLRNKA